MNDSSTTYYKNFEFKFKMADDAAALVEYILVTESGETKNTSVEYSGKGKATYPNGDVYEGEFVNGVSSSISSLNGFRKQGA